VHASAASTITTSGYRPPSIPDFLFENNSTF
jgi:hypothetical protein